MNAKRAADSGIMANTPPSPCARMQNLSAEALAQVAAYFQALAEPARLRLLNLLRGSERSVGELAEATGYSAANVSRHLTLPARHGPLTRGSRRSARPAPPQERRSRPAGRLVLLPRRIRGCRAPSRSS